MTLVQGSASAIPLDDAAVDVVVSGLVLNFVPDRADALREMQRVASAGGTVACYVWDYAEGMELMRYFWDAAVELDPRRHAHRRDTQLPLCNPGTLAQTLPRRRAAGGGGRAHRHADALSRLR